MSVAVLLQERSARSARVILREWIRDYIEDKDEVRSEEIVAAAYAKFSHDEEFIEAILADGIALLVPLISNEIWGANRKPFRQTAGGAVSTERLEERREIVFSKMFENAGEGRHVSLTAMRRPELRTAIEVRSADLDGRARRLGFLREIESGMKNDRKTVGETFSQTRLEALWRKHNES